MLPYFLTHFMPPVFFYTWWKYQKTRGFLKFSKDRKRPVAWNGLKPSWKVVKCEIEDKNIKKLLVWFLPGQDDMKLKSFILISFIIEYCHLATIIRVSFGTQRYLYELLFYFFLLFPISGDLSLSIPPLKYQKTSRFSIFSKSYWNRPVTWNWLILI